MASKKLSLYKLAKFSNFEIVMESQVQSSGANQARLMERYKKNKNYVKHQAVGMRVAYAFMFGMVAFIPVINYFQLVDILKFYYISDSMLFAGCLIFSLFFGFQLMYLIFMGMFSIGSLMSGEIFQWFETLPLSKNRLHKLGFFTVIRNLDLAFVLMVLSFPVVIAIVSHNFLLVLVCSLISIINLIFAFSILILVAGKISKILKVHSAGSRKSTMIRIFTMLGYVLVIMSASLVIQWAVSSMASFFIIISSLDIPYLVIILTSFIPFPFAPSYLITMLISSMFISPSNFPVPQWIATIIGIVLLILLTWILYKKAVKSMRLVTSSSSIEVKQVVDLKQSQDISVKIKTPIKSYISKDMYSTTRDIQSFMFLIMPLIMPFLIIVAFIFIPTGEFGDIQLHFISMWSLTMFYQPLISLMIITGFLNMEDSGASITASLPINPRDQAKAKLIILITIQTFSFFLPIIAIILINPAFQAYISLLISWYPVALVFLFSGFYMKLKLFGRMKYKYVLEEVNPEKKISKWIFLITSEALIFLFFTVLSISLLTFTDIFLSAMILFLIGTTILSLLINSLNKMFPKEFGIRIMVSVRDKFRIQPIKGIIVILLMYALFLLISAFIDIIFMMISIPYIPTTIVINFIISFLLMSLFWLFLVPRVFHMPNGNEKLKLFLYSIKLRPTKNLVRNIVIAIGCALIYFTSTYIAANIFGVYIFDLNVIFGTPDQMIFRIGWLFFIIMLIPGIWEEVAFRGVITTLSLKKYSEFSSLILGAVLFGLFHFVNLLIGNPLVTTIIQVLYATILGILLGYIFLKTKSLIPCIILHYLIDSAGQLFMNAYFTDIPSFYAFAILGIGIFPMVFGILFAYLIIKIWKNNR